MTSFFQQQSTRDMQDARLAAGIKAVADALGISASGDSGSFGLLQGIAVRCGVELNDDATRAPRIANNEGSICQVRQSTMQP